MYTDPTFLFIQVMNSFALGMNLFIIAVGLTLIFGVLHVINFAHGSFFMIGAYVLFSVLRATGDSTLMFVVGVLAAMIVMGLVAFVIERIFLRRLYDGEHLLQLLFTFALVLIFSDLVRIIWGPLQYSVSYPPMLKGAVYLGLSYYPKYLLFLALCGPVLAIALWLFIERTRWGRIVRAARQDREMLAALGSNVTAIYSSVFVLGAMLAAMGGALAAPRLAVEPGMDGLIIIDCFIIVIIGGLGSLWGSFLGSLAVGFVTVFGRVIFNEWEIVLVYVLMLIVLLWRPWGLLGKKIEDRH